MQRFKNDQKIVVTDREHPAFEKTGTVVRLRRADAQAWVNMDVDLPVDRRSFPETDIRRNHIRLWPDECEAVEA